ncbi:MAG TPA: hypothetical protein VMS21_11670 [Methylomirabilota bacterium]|nr:hypothetical protein [Methylomirabilota bacterium]
MLATLAGLCVVLGWRNIEALNSDAVAYLRIASYYAGGQVDLMVSGYWGPMLSWLMAPLLAVGVDALAAGRCIMGASAVVFWAGCMAMFRAWDLPPRWLNLGGWVAALAAAGWSVRGITPDLLAAGLVGLAMARLVRAEWAGGKRIAFVCGMLWGAAYLTKAIALPLGILVTLAFALTHWRFGAGLSSIATASLATAVGLLVIAAPWLTVLSIRYDRFTFSTTGKIAHALAGPEDEERYHPIVRSFHVPEAGRVTAWEDPSEMDYAFWSPFASAEYAKHQVWVMATNALKIGVMLSVICLLVPVLVVEGLIRGVQRRMRIGSRGRWWQPFLLLGPLAALYLPFHLDTSDIRYFYVALPALWVVLARGQMESASEKLESGSGGMRWREGLAVAAFGLPAAGWLIIGVVSYPNLAPAARVARVTAERMEAAGLAGSLAGSGLMPGGRTGLYTAWFMGQPWLGDEPMAAPERYRASGARFVLLRRDDPAVELLVRSESFRDLDQVLFGDGDEPVRFPVKVFESVGESGQPL